MSRREHIAERIAEAVLKRLQIKKHVEPKDGEKVRAAIRRVLVEDLQAEERLDADARQILLEHTKDIKDSAADYRRLFSLVKGRLARERGFIL
ncbi:MAG: DUF507 family protein [Candidatus Methylomirabilia bacterium]